MMSFLDLTYSNLLPRSRRLNNSIHIDFRETVGGSLGHYEISARVMIASGGFSLTSYWQILHTRVTGEIRGPA